jgi:hypothetical protein
MNPKQKPALLTLTVCAFMAPYLGFVVYVNWHYSPGQWPSWVGNTILIWFVTNVLVIALLMNRMSRGRVMDAAPAVTAKGVRAGARLIILWSLLFLYEVKETVQGKFPLNRAIPVGIFLLIFIAILGRGIYRAKRGKA